MTYQSPEDTFHHYSEKKIVNRALVSLKSSVITLLCRPVLIVGTTVTESGNLNAMGVIGSWGSKGQMVALNHQGQGGHGYHNG